MTMDRAGMHLQVGDIHFLMKYARQVAQADTRKIAIVGYSWGGISNAFAAVDKPNVRALVFLDGSIRYFTTLIEDGKLNRGKPFAIPMLYFSSGSAAFKDELGRTETGATLLPGLTSGKRYLFKMERMKHGDFGSLTIRQTPPSSNTSTTSRDVSASYGWVAQYTLQFLNASLKGDRKAGAFMERSPSANNVPDGLIAEVITTKQ